MPAVVKQGNMMEHVADCDHFIVCTGSHCLDQSGPLIMLRGMAYELSQKYPTAPKAMGRLICDSVGSGGVFGLMCNNKFGMFQTHFTHREDFNMVLCSKATHMLRDLALANPEKIYYLDRMWDKAPKFLFDGFIKMLPDNVTIWEP